MLIAGTVSQARSFLSANHTISSYTVPQQHPHRIPRYSIISETLGISFPYTNFISCSPYTRLGVVLTKLSLSWNLEIFSFPLMRSFPERSVLQKRSWRGKRFGSRSAWTANTFPDLQLPYFTFKEKNKTEIDVGGLLALLSRWFLSHLVCLQPWSEGSCSTGEDTSVKNSLVSDIIDGEGVALIF